MCAGGPEPYSWRGSSNTSEGMRGVEWDDEVMVERLEEKLKI
jgi:hypothetical protein